MTTGRHLECATFVNFGTILSYARKIRKGAMVKDHAELKIEKPRVKTFNYEFPNLHHSNPNSFGADVHLRQICSKRERSRDVTPRSKCEKAPKAANGVHHVSLIGCHLESASSTKLVLKLVRALGEVSGRLLVERSLTRGN